MHFISWYRDKYFKWIQISYINNVYVMKTSLLLQTSATKTLLVFPGPDYDILGPLG